MNCTPLLKGIFVTFFFCFLFLNSFAQNEAESTTDSTIVFQREFGIDAHFINTFLPLENNIGRGASYLLNYRKYRTNKKILRMGFDINLSGNFDENESTTADRVNNLVDINYRVGWGTQRDIFKNTFLFSGFDLLLHGFFNQIKVEESREGARDGNRKTTYQFLTGTGPFLGIQYNFTKRIGIFTEMKYYLNLSYTLESIKFDDERDPDSLDKQFNYFDTLSLPGSIVLFFKL